MLKKNFFNRGFEQIEASYVTSISVEVLASSPIITQDFLDLLRRNLSPGRQAAVADCVIITAVKPAAA